MALILVVFLRVLSRRFLKLLGFLVGTGGNFVCLFVDRRTNQSSPFIGVMAGAGNPNERVYPYTLKRPFRLGCL